jgi:hypothetical protein
MNCEYEPGEMRIEDGMGTSEGRSYLWKASGKKCLSLKSSE